jgi:hypothetical protein
VTLLSTGAAHAIIGSTSLGLAVTVVAVAVLMSAQWLEWSNGKRGALHRVVLWLAAADLAVLGSLVLLRFLTIA